MKKIVAVFAALLMAFSFFACGKKEDITLDADTVADALSAELAFDDVLEKSTADVLYSFYDIEESDCEKAAFYAGSGATADEIAVITAADGNALAKIKTAVEARIKYLHDGYSDYGPSEVPKIDSSVVLTKGNTLIFVVCKNPEAVEAIVDSLAQ